MSRCDGEEGQQETQPAEIRNWGEKVKRVGKSRGCVRRVEAG